MFIALTSSSSEDLEDAGRSGEDAACAPNEALDAVWKTSGLGGPQGEGGVRSKSVGCKPHCATWEFVAEPSEDGEEYMLGSLALLAGKVPFGGPEGEGGVFSSNIGCFAPCYWEIGTPVQVRLRHQDLIGVKVESTDDNYGPTSGGALRSTGRGYILSDPSDDSDENPGSRLRYYNDNRAPVEGEIRLGVTYRRILDSSEQLERAGGLFVATELQRSESDSIDGNPYFYTSPLERHSASGRWGHGLGVRNAPGTPLSPQQIAEGVPTVHEPNWYSPRINILASSEWGRFNTYFEDEDWEIRADPENEVCEIVYTPTDRLICSSDNDSCRELHISFDDCPLTLGGRAHALEGDTYCRLP